MHIKKFKQLNKKSKYNFVALNMITGTPNLLPNLTTITMQRHTRMNWLLGSKCLKLLSKNQKLAILAGS